MTARERAEAAYQRWLAAVSDDVRRLVQGTPYEERFIEVVAAAVSETQEEVALGAGTAELPHGKRF